MQLSKELTTVTPFSKYLAMVLFILFPFIGFYLGMQYQARSNTYIQLNHNNQAQIIIKKNPTPIPSQTNNWKTYTNTLESYSFQYPSDWKLKQETRQGFDKPWISIYPNVAPCLSNVNPSSCETAQVIYIYSENNPKNLSIQDFIGSNHTSLQPIAISGLPAYRTIV